MRGRTRLRKIVERLSDIPSKLGLRLAYHQKKSGLTDTELAKAASITVNYLDHMKNGATKPSKATLAKLAKALKVTVAELVE
jgi:transcriptional regulator with XRE-family HTH domain